MSDSVVITWYNMIKVIELSKNSMKQNKFPEYKSALDRTIFLSEVLIIGSAFLMIQSDNNETQSRLAILQIDYSDAKMAPSYNHLH